MENISLVITVHSASDLGNVRMLFKMKVYCTVFISSNPHKKESTHVNKIGGLNPTWNSTKHLTLNELELQRTDIFLVFHLYCKRKRGDKYIGEVSVAIKELSDKLDRGPGGDAQVVISYPVDTESAGPQGSITFSYNFDENVAAEAGEQSQGPTRTQKVGIGIGVSSLVVGILDLL